MSQKKNNYKSSIKKYWYFLLYALTNTLALRCNVTDIICIISCIWCLYCSLSLLLIGIFNSLIAMYKDSVIFVNMRSCFALWCIHGQSTTTYLVLWTKVIEEDLLSTCQRCICHVMSYQEYISSTNWSITVIFTKVRISVICTPHRLRTATIRWKVHTLQFTSHPRRTINRFILWHEWQCVCT